MGPHSHSPEEASEHDSHESWIDRWRKRQEARRRLRETEPEAPATPEKVAEDAAEEAPKKKRARRMGRAIIQALRPSSTEQTPHHSPEQLDKEVTHGRRVRIITRQVFGLLNRRREEVMQAAVHEPPAEVAREVAPINLAEAHLQRADAEVAEELTHAEATGAEETVGFARTVARPRVESAMDAPSEIPESTVTSVRSTPDYDPFKVTQMRPPVSAETAQRIETAAASSAKTAEYATRRANQAAGVAVVAGAGAAWALHRAHQAREQAQEVKNQQKEVRTEQQDFARRLEQNEQAVQRLRSRPENLQSRWQRQEAMQQVVQVAERQKTLSTQSAERLRVQRSVEALGARSPATPVTQSPEGTAPEAAAAVQQPLAPEVKRQPPTNVEALLGVPVSAELLKPPSERELSDRVERQPGRTGTVHDTSRDNGAPQTVSQSVVTPTTTGPATVAAPHLSKPAEAHAKNAPGAPHSTTLALVIVTIIVAMGILFLLTKL